MTSVCELPDRRAEPEPLGFARGHHKARLHQRLQQAVQRGPTQWHPLQQLGGAQFMVVDRERFQNVQSPLNGPDAFAAVDAHAQTFQNPVVRVCISVSAWWTALSFYG